MPTRASSTPRSPFVPRWRRGTGTCSTRRRRRGVRPERSIASSPPPRPREVTTRRRASSRCRRRRSAPPPPPPSEPPPRPTLPSPSPTPPSESNGRPRRRSAPTTSSTCFEGSPAPRLWYPRACPSTSTPPSPPTRRRGRRRETLRTCSRRSRRRKSCRGTRRGRRCSPRSSARRRAPPPRRSRRCSTGWAAREASARVFRARIRSLDGSSPSWRRRRRGRLPRWTRGKSRTCCPPSASPSRTRDSPATPGRRSTRLSPARLRGCPPRMSRPFSSATTARAPRRRRPDCSRRLPSSPTRPTPWTRSRCSRRGASNPRRPPARRSPKPSSTPPPRCEPGTS